MFCLIMMHFTVVIRQFKLFSVIPCILHSFFTCLAVNFVLPPQTFFHLLHHFCGLPFSMVWRVFLEMSYCLAIILSQLPLQNNKPHLCFSRNISHDFSVKNQTNVRLQWLVKYHYIQRWYNSHLKICMLSIISDLSLVQKVCIDIVQLQVA